MYKILIFQLLQILLNNLIERVVQSHRISLLQLWLLRFLHLILADHDFEVVLHRSVIYQLVDRKLLAFELRGADVISLRHASRALLPDCVH